MGTQISPMLAVSDGAAAIEFYKAAFGASVLWSLGGGGHIVAGLSIDGARFFLAQESPPYGTRSPDSVGFTTVRIELFVDDPVAVQTHALAAGAVEHSPGERTQVRYCRPGSDQANASGRSCESVRSHVANRRVWAPLGNREAPQLTALHRLDILM
jgi:PhnB protein